MHGNENEPPPSYRSPLRASTQRCLSVCVHVGFFFTEWTFLITLCQPDISTHISISAAHSVSSHTDRARASRPVAVVSVHTTYKVHLACGA
eukprot:scaffold16903_cov133-Isochrysis_galbana.AAC.6